MSDDDHQLIDHVIFTPAERALIREKIEGVRVDLDIVYEKATNSDSPGLMRAFIDVSNAMDYLNQMMGQKSKALMFDLMSGKITDGD